jgi:hypothetical protein
MLMPSDFNIPSNLSRLSINFCRAPLHITVCPLSVNVNPSSCAFDHGAFVGMFKLVGGMKGSSGVHGSSIGSAARRA